ncbi:malonyl-CoA O-methyltransferase [Acetivibrio thermocellus AD2]|uniref:Malonyl-[acyl-carrier protein] O-methyltransferase n=1 Tax=Acetivibrio thermocellus AD2 TaxID=1138384 RepID=A0AB36TIS8_ACETH|nr:malonyl-ACP O-methyltransferase BioC [Acetivibrio thermocellus]ADU75246.1 biotin biosynthesis protein BioC [Acetivibrio thermocellus DSM 1313]ALX09226.1 biotin biosynthesis protein BioC [Acetivibrio thermocellus AD2]ANV76978.1 biotin biosynthesis protein BioC [Acetivibrio thermocellus DSM 2360]EIC04801.1 biotin biosynthesis protein BioC [Acetivibrio thermocellus YS]PFH03501.1 malonyl-CoA O-methyltransferase [Acetivibrio thermocellus AD2]
MIDKKILQMHFSRNAKNYDAYAKVQKKMANTLLDMLDLDSKNRLDILDVGCGTGYLTKLLLDRWPDARITAIDIAPGMIEYARDRFNESNVEFACLDIEEAELNQKYDLVISNATFQWFNDLGGTVNKLVQSLKSDGVLAFSTFGHMTFSELHFSYETARRKLKIDEEFPPGQKFCNAKEILKICCETFEGLEGFEFDTVKKESLEYEYFYTVREFLDSVKKIGANNSNKQRKVNTALTKEMIRIYEEMFKVNGLVRATYHCIFITSRKKLAANTRRLVNAVV